MMSWSARAARRGAGAVFFRPPLEHLRTLGWHNVDTPDGVKLMQWRPGVDRWIDDFGRRFTSEFAGANGWVYIAPASGPAER